jgi:hypothetical protein
MTPSQGLLLARLACLGHGGKRMCATFGSPSNRALAEGVSVQGLR